MVGPRSMRGKQTQSADGACGLLSPPGGACASSRTHASTRRSEKTEDSEAAFDASRLSGLHVQQNTEPGLRGAQENSREATGPGRGAAGRKPGSGQAPAGRKRRALRSRPVRCPRAGAGRGDSGEAVGRAGPAPGELNLEAGGLGDGRPSPPETLPERDRVGRAGSELRRALRRARVTALPGSGSRAGGAAGREEAAWAA